MFDIIKGQVALVTEHLLDMSKALVLTYNTKNIKLNRQSKIK